MVKRLISSIIFSGLPKLCGVISVMLAIFLCRFEVLYHQRILPQLPPIISSWILDKSSWLLSYDCLRYWRKSTPAGLLFLIIGLTFLSLPHLLKRLRRSTLTSQKPTNQLPSSLLTRAMLYRLASESRGGSADRLPSYLVKLALFSLIISFILEQLHILNSPIAFIGWLILISLPTIHLLKRDKTKQLSLALPLSLRELFLLISCSIALILFYQRGVDSWRYAFIGDEYGFFGFASSLIYKSFAEASPLEASGYAEFFPMLLSWWQALFLMIFGEHNAAWRLSVGVITASCLIPFYIFLKLLLHKIYPSELFGVQRYPLSFFPVVLVASTSLFLTEFTVVWAKIGKPHAVFLPPAIFAVSALYLGIRRRSDFYVFLSGLFIGLATYLSSLSPILAFTASGILLITMELRLGDYEVIRFIKVIIRSSFILTAAFLIVAAPLLVQFDFWQNMFEVNLTSSEAESNYQFFWAKLISAIMLPLEFRTGIHFMFGNPIDVLLAFLVILGLTAANIVGWRPLTFVILLHLAFSFLAGGISKYAYPPESRMMVVMFPLALLAAFGFLGLWDLLSVSGRWVFAKYLKLSLSALICSWVAIYHWVKLEEYNPHAQQINSSIAILKTIQQSPDQRRSYWLFATPKINRAPLYLFAEIFEPPYLLRSFTNEADMIPKIKQLLHSQLASTDKTILPSAIIIEAEEPLREELSSLANDNGISLLTFDSWGLAARRVDLAPPLVNLLFPLVKLLESRGEIAERLFK